MTTHVFCSLLVISLMLLASRIIQVTDQATMAFYVLRRELLVSPNATMDDLCHPPQHGQKSLEVALQVNVGNEWQNACQFSHLDNIGISRYWRLIVSAKCGILGRRILVLRLSTTLLR